VQSTSLVAPSVPEKKAETNVATLKRWIINAPDKIVKLLRIDDTNTQVQIMDLVMKAWATGVLSAAAKAVLASSPLVVDYFVLTNTTMDMGGQGYGRGSKRKRSVGSSRGRGRGSNKRHRHQHHHY
jgi:hypothetical protein